MRAVCIGCTTGTLAINSGMTVTTDSNDDSKFLSALARLEQSLETPVVPGELPDWLARARGAAQEVADRLRQGLSERHVELFRQIANQDAELAPRIEQLREKDAELLVQENDLRWELNQLCEKADRAEPHEARLHEQVDNFTRRAIAFVIAARTQETAITTWYMESFQRDRGVVD